MIVQNNI